MQDAEGYSARFPVSHFTCRGMTELRQSILESVGASVERVCSERLKFCLSFPNRGQSLRFVHSGGLCKPQTGRIQLGRVGISSLRREKLISLGLLVLLLVTDTSLHKVSSLLSWVFWLEVVVSNGVEFEVLQDTYHEVLQITCRGMTELRQSILEGASLLAHLV
jgi:hypothetical protein